MKNKEAETLLSCVKQKISIDPVLAVALGLAEAVIVQQLHFLMGIAKNDSRHCFGGKKWVWNTYAEWQTYLPFLSRRMVADKFRALEQKGIVVSTRKGYDPTKYYTLDYAVLSAYVQRSEQAMQFLHAAETSMCEQLRPYFELPTPKTGDARYKNQTSDTPEDVKAKQIVDISQIDSDFPEGVL